MHVVRVWLVCVLRVACAWLGAWRLFVHLVLSVWLVCAPRVYGIVRVHLVCVHVRVARVVCAWLLCGLC